MRTLPLAILLSCGAALAAPVAAPAPAKVDMDLALETGAAPTTAREWYQLLTELKVDNLRLGSGGAAVKPDIAKGGTAAAPVYKVTGTINRTGQLLLPGGRFRASDRARLAQWIATLREEGPERAAGAPREPFGLSKEQLAAIRNDLARPVTFSTQGMAPDEVGSRLVRSLSYPIAGTAKATKFGRSGDVMDVELEGMASGTALAYVLDRAGLAVAPGLDARRQPCLAIAAIAAQGERWPVGRRAEQADRHVLPALFEKVEVKLDKVELPRVLAKIREQLHVPLLVDSAGLAREGIDLDQLRASMPEKPSMYAIVLDKILVPNFLVYELRVDDAGKPFLWIAPARKATSRPTKDGKR